MTEAENKVIEEQQADLKLVEDTEEAPEVAAPPPEDPNVLGVLEPNEMGVLVALQQQARAIVQHIGELEVEKARALKQMESLEAQNNQHLQGISKRLNIPNDCRWQVTQDGKVRKVS